MKKINDKKAILYVGNDKKRIFRTILFILADVFSVLVATVGALWVRFDFSFQGIDRVYLEPALKMLPFNILSVIIIYTLFKLYISVWRYASASELLEVVLAVICNSALQLIVFIIFKVRVPRSYYLFYIAILGILTLFTRFSYRLIRVIKNKGKVFKGRGTYTNVMIVGAGAACNSIMKELETSQMLEKQVKCLIDDNPGCQGKMMRGVPIVGGREAIPDAVKKYEIGEIIIAIPTASKTEIKKLVEICKETGCKLEIVPGIYQLINGEVSVSQLREVDIEDLLGREPAKINADEVAGYVKGKTVMVTGGGGSIGSELCRQVAKHEPKRLIIVDIYENNAYDIQQELKRKYPELDLVVLIASVRNTLRIDQIFDEYRPNIVYHAAAHKHVPLMEDSPGEAIKNNVFGTYKTAKAADKYGAEKFVLVSTDKAVNPTNIMGASKRMCEMVVQMMNEQSKTDFVAVRFGNVLGSNGSVIPLFKKQIAAGGPVTVTDPNIIRYFMTIPEAVSLILQAGAYAKGGEIFVLDMGEPVKIVDLAENLIKLSGYRVGDDIEIVFTGLRPGEKMYEEMLMKEEGLKSTANNLIHIGKPIDFDKDEFKKQLEELDVISREEPEKVKETVSRIVPTYKYVKGQ
ncbi:MAG: polysaccharide biosynthesis protein [Lachnospiraceae bacterium]|nr:polysaccharide biosynthesis protein [Lachnospiraceae bacterium]